jgi:hypothetical protein
MPAVVEVVEGRLRVRVFSHVITSMTGPVPCWTYVSDGLLAAGQKEISLTVKRREGEAEGAFPRAPLDFYRTLHRLALEKRFVEEGDVTQLDPHGPGLLRDDFHGILYTPPQKLEGASTPAPFLTAVVVTEAELEVIARYGHLRFMAILGDRYRFYPTTPWADRERSPITGPEAMASSFLTRLPPVHLRGASARLEPPPGGPTFGEGASVVLRLRAEAAKALLADIEQRGPDSAFAFSMDLDPEADACLVYSPGSRTPGAISAPGATGARISGNMLAMAPEAQEDVVRAVEDGFGMSLTNATWTRFRAALSAREPFSLEARGEGMRFSLAWIEQRYDNPFDGKAYIDPEGWRTHYPMGGGLADAGKTGVVRSTGIRMLTPEHEVEGRVEVKPLVDYLGKIDAVLEAGLGGDTSGPAFDVLVLIDLAPPGTATTRLAARPSERAPNSLSAIATRIQALPPPPIRNGPVSLQVGYVVRGGTGAPLP